MIRWPELWLILAGPMALNNLSAPSSEASGGTQGMGGLRSNHRGIGGGGDLWLAARIAQHRCVSEWTHLSLPEGARPLWPSARWSRVPMA